MNKKLAGSIAIALFLLAGCAASGPKLASSAEDIVGTWVAPEGIASAYKFDEDGTWRESLSLARLDEPYAQGEFWFEDMQFFIKYTEGFVLRTCGELAGSYDIELLDTGNISFTVVEDECQGRVDGLQAGGVADGGQIEWAPVP